MTLKAINWVQFHHKIYVTTLISVKYAVLQSVSCAFYARILKSRNN